MITLHALYLCNTQEEARTEIDHHYASTSREIKHATDRMIKLLLYIKNKTIIEESPILYDNYLKNISCCMLKFFIGNKKMQ